MEDYVTHDDVEDYDGAWCLISLIILLWHCMSCRSAGPASLLLLAVLAST